MRSLLLLTITAFGTLALTQQAKPVDPDWKVPEKAAAQQNPLRDRPQLAAGGRKVFERNCAMCHGDDKHERKNNAPDLASPEVQQETDGSLFWRISNGNSRKGMPAFSNFPEPQRWQLVLYIRSLAKQ